MCSAVPSTPGTQSIAQMLKKMMNPVPAQNPAGVAQKGSAAAPQDTLEISATAQQMAGKP